VDERSISLVLGMVRGEPPLTGLTVYSVCREYSTSSGKSIA